MHEIKKLCNIENILSIIFLKRKTLKVQWKFISLNNCNCSYKLSQMDITLSDVHLYHISCCNLIVIQIKYM